MTQQFHITNADMRALRKLLGEIPGLIDDLAIALTRQARTNASPIVSTGSDEQPLPYDIGASDAHELLNQTLADWASLVHTNAFTHPHWFIGPLRLTDRRQPAPPGTTTIRISRWLERNVTHLARIPGAEDAYSEIAYAMEQARDACDLPDDKAVIPTEPQKVEQIEALELNARDCAARARDAGIELTKRRVDYLGETRLDLRLGKNAAGEWIYRLGDILNANGTPLHTDLHRERHMLS